MKKNIIALTLFLLTLMSVLAQDPAQTETVPQPPDAQANATPKPPQESMADKTANQLSTTADEDLAKTINELNQLRDQIAAEKLPLAQELTASEARLAELRQNFDQLTRKTDTGNLELIALKAEQKARQDELTYIANIMDEYVRSFETKVNISELQPAAVSLDPAKQATENTALQMEEKFAKQIAFVDFSLKRIASVIGGMRFPGAAVDMQGNIQEGQFAIIGPIALFRSTLGNVAGLVMPQGGSTKPLVRPLEGKLQEGIASLVESGEGLLPLDPSRGGALKAHVQKTDLVHIFKKGGPIMWPLLLVACLAILTVTERFIFLINESRRRDPASMERFFTEIDQGDLSGAIRISRESKFYLVRTLGYALEHREKSLANALIYAQEQEMKRFRRGIPILDTVITLAPLLGLLGTVTGMMGSFSLIGGDLGAPGAITGGIAEALIATAFGLGIAITSLIPFNYLNTKMDEARIEIETAASQLELLVHPGELVTEASDEELILANT